ncbi:MAG: D-alanyl-D-alanine carboxypeptidase [Candidatus Babeliales bacterium]
MKIVKLLLLGSLVSIFSLSACGQLPETASVRQRVEELLSRPSSGENRPIWNVAFNFKNFLKKLVSPIRIGVKVTAIKSGRVIFDEISNQRFIPYGNTMLITAGAALSYLGDDFTFKTQILTDGVVNGNAVEGNLYFKGGGDPSFSGYDVIAFIGQLAAMGITTITGGFYCDYSDYDEMPYTTGASLADAVEYWTSPVFAMIVDHNYVDRSLPGRTTFNFTLNCDPDSLLVQSITISSMKNVFSAYVQGICAAYGITIQGVLDLGKAPDGATVLVTKDSAPLTQLITAMLANTYSIYADSIFKMVGAKCLGFPGTWEKGAQAISNFLEQKVGILGSEFHLEDGSGISRNNSFSPSNMVKFLSWMSKSPLSDSFMSCLSPVGTNKVLKGIMGGKRVKALTRGEIVHGVSTLSGFVYANNRPSEVFSVMFDGMIPPKESIKPSETEEELIEKLLGCLTT